LANTNIFIKDERVEKILDLLLKYTLGEYHERLAISPKGDELDAIIIGLNTLGEEAEASGKIVRDFEERVGNIMDGLLKYTLFNFSEKIKVGDVGDELDAIAIGLNTLAEELESARKTEQTHLERIEETNHFLDTILENIPNMVFVKDAKELRFVRFNKAGEELLGYLRADLIGKNDYDFFPKEQADFFTAKDREALAKNGVTDIPEELIDTANGPKWLHTKKIPLRDSEGKPIYLLGISEDITGRKNNEDQIRSLNTELKNNVNQLESTNNELEAFTYSVSHDLRAPLRAIHGYSAILEKEYADKLDADAKSMMASVMNNALKMGQLIDDLLALSRFGKKELQVKETDMTELVKQGLTELKKSMDTSKAKITIDQLHKAIVDPALLFQVFFNLLSNAVKYSSLKDKPEITISSKKQNDEIIYTVSDNGSGFDMKYYDKLFGVFQRLHDAHEFEGTGVGLALVKRIITRHNGRVWAEAEVEKGATFYVALPILKQN
jgi:PAS domain S-box-containing protein